MTCPENIAIGAYVLGALDVEERRATEQHLATCESCRETLLQFAPLPGLLHTVPLEDVESAESWNSVDEPTGSAAEIHDSTTVVRRIRRRKRMRWMVMAAVVAVVASVVGVAGWWAMGGEEAPQAITWTATDGVDGIDTTATLTGQPWGTDIQLRMADLRPGEHCRLVIHARNGDVETSGWWATTRTYQADVPASTSIPLTDIDRLEVVTSTDKILSTLTPESR
jgi:Putative zinc-finger